MKDQPDTATVAVAHAPRFRQIYLDGLVSEIMGLTVDTLRQRLGLHSSTIRNEAPFQICEFKRSVERDLKPPRIYYECRECGIDIICDEDESVRAIIVSDNDSHSCKVNLPDLPFATKRNEVIERLGSPNKSGGLVNDPVLGDLGPWDRFTKAHHALHIEYRVDGDEIAKITLMRLDAVP
jgi:hypothetical protein